MIGALISMYRPAYLSVLVYMLQGTEYQSRPYLKWYWQTNNFGNVVKRRTLDKTKAAKLLLATLQVGASAQIVAGIVLIILGLNGTIQEGVLLGLAVVISYPVVWAHMIVIPLALGRLFIVKPHERQLIADSKIIFKNHKGTKIAVAGSYGKTSMKELLSVVLSEGKKVAATPGNKNVSSSHAAFAKKLAGDEDVLIIEYGEGEPGDVARFCEITQPSVGIITGIAPAHLDKYPTLDDAARDIFSLADFLGDTSVYVNGESSTAKVYVKPKHNVYSRKGLSDFQVGSVSVSVEGTNFEVARGNKTQIYHTKLLGRHHVGPLLAAIVVAGKLGLNDSQIKAGVANTKPYEHRMSPYQLSGAWIIDDTYNGNIEGIRAGLELLGELKASKKIYVTPGLVDQGVEHNNVHQEMGKVIAKANPDKVVLMKNSATVIIAESLRAAGFEGEVVMQDDPLAFYQNLEHFVAKGDLVLMQNDWTDNYK